MKMMTPVELQFSQSSTPAAGGSTVAPSVTGVAYYNPSYNTAGEQKTTADDQSVLNYGSGYAALQPQQASQPPLFQVATSYPAVPGYESVNQNTLQTPVAAGSPAPIMQQPMAQQPIVQQPVIMQPAGPASFVPQPGYQLPVNQSNVTGSAAQQAQQNEAPVQWMAKPVVATNCPPGLEYLTQLNQLAFIQQPNVWIDGMKKITSFSVRNLQDQQVYATQEQLGNVLKVVATDAFGQEAILVSHQPVGCGNPACYCFACCQSCKAHVTVESPPGQIVGTVEQRLATGMTAFVVCDCEGSPMLRIEGEDPIGRVKNVWRPEFFIYSLDYSSTLGKFAYPSTMSMMEVNANELTEFDLVFPLDLDVRTKATLIGAALLLHHYYFGFRFQERRGGSHHHHHRVHHHHARGRRRR